MEVLHRMESLVLDVGCGVRPRGDVNVDLYIEPMHRNGKHIDTTKVQNFIKADGRDMHMFTDRQFSKVFCDNVIEHIPDWWNLLTELWRVTGHHLVIICPHRSWINFPNQFTRSKHHVSNFDRQVWEEIIPRFLKTRNYEVTTEYRGMFHKLIPFPLWPHKIRVDVYRD